ncbi:ROK family protein [Paenibacillus harenae]|uniref:ROK family protein n=1 Tax=Paenibacillus harenae TaxID=306543 RepID=UPI0006881181|nr:ROK family protein [Paenibacillus harenae]
MHLGIDLGGTHIKSVILDAHRKVLQERQTETNAAAGVEAVTANLSELILDCERASPGSVQSIGIAVPGVLDQEREHVLLLPNFPFDWSGNPLKDQLLRMTGRSVELVNDARAAAAAYAELRAGASRGCSDFVFLVIGTGVGGGVVHKGELIMGSRGVAGELGHQVIRPGGLRCGCGNRGCLETIASGPAIASAAVRTILQGLPTLIRDLVKGDMGLVSSRIVSEAAERGDRHAIEILTEAADGLVQAIRNSIALLNPEAVIIGGGVARSKMLLELVRNGLEREVILFPPSLGGIAVKEAEFGTYAGAVGAAAWAMSTR